MSTAINITVDDGGLPARNRQQVAANRQAFVQNVAAKQSTALGVDQRSQERIAQGRDPATGALLIPPASAGSLGTSGSSFPRFDQQPAANRTEVFVKKWIFDYAAPVIKTVEPSTDGSTGYLVVDSPLCFSKIKNGKSEIFYFYYTQQDFSSPVIVSSIASQRVASCKALVNNSLILTFDPWKASVLYPGSSVYGTFIQPPPTTRIPYKNYSSFLAETEVYLPRIDPHTIGTTTSTPGYRRFQLAVELFKPSLNSKILVSVAVTIAIPTAGLDGFENWLRIDCSSPEIQARDPGPGLVFDFYDVLPEGKASFNLALEFTKDGRLMVFVDDSQVINVGTGTILPPARHASAIRMVSVQEYVGGPEAVGDPLTDIGNPDLRLNPLVFTFT